MSEFSHTSVLLVPAVEGLAIRPDGVYVDGTLGGGGHSLEIAKRLTGGGKLIGIDRDQAAIEAAGSRLAAYRDRVEIVKANYGEMADILSRRGIPGVDGILLDLGVSSYQLDTFERGFSYREDAPLDMRMDREEEQTAYDIVNGYSEEELARILREYGEEKCASAIARRIVKEREKAPICTMLELVEVIRSAMPLKMQRTGGHPAKRTFQALRIELNRELSVLSDSLDTMIGLLNPGGRLCVITFHSLEDRIVKQAFRTAENPCICPKQFPVCVCGRKSLGQVVTRKAILPSEEEMEANSRARSAKLRIFSRG